MITKIQLQKEATVLAEDGKKVGSLERVVVNPDTNVITDIVVSTGGLLNQTEKVVPIDLILETTDNKILLHEDAGELQSFPPLEEEHIVNEHGNVNGPISSDGRTPSVVAGYPVMGTPVVLPPGKRIVTRLEQNIPEGTVAMKEGASVLAVDGRHVGKVEGVIAEPFKGQIVNFVVSSGLFYWTNKIIPIKWVRSISDESVRLRVDKSVVENLVEEPVAG